MATLFLVEDHKMTRKLAKSHLEYDHKHSVLETDNLHDALDAIKDLTLLGVEVAILDANLTQDDDSGNDGKTIADAIREACPDIRILCWSRTAYSWGDAFHLKSHDYDALVMAVDVLLEK